MRKRLTYLITLILIVSLVSCVPYTAAYSPPSATPSGPRTIVIDGEQISEEDWGGCVCWTCQDYVTREDIIVEVGYFLDPPTQEVNGFILHDGGNSGEIAVYERRGLEHNWYWGESREAFYSIVIRSDGTGFYYDFSNFSDREETKPKSIFICKQR